MGSRTQRGRNSPAAAAGQHPTGPPSGTWAQALWSLPALPGQPWLPSCPQQAFLPHLPTPRPGHHHLPWHLCSLSNSSAMPVPWSGAPRTRAQPSGLSAFHLQPQLPPHSPVRPGPLLQLSSAPWPTSTGLPPRSVTSLLRFSSWRLPPPRPVLHTCWPVSPTSRSCAWSGVASQCCEQCLGVREAA